ncbi:hypothetical protein L1987_29751 [Smallanthus sonchifolius]|uniref:Uncharacterized protein n=1 Tax=Smallanthus sonchifolius TaxID=185202 RepID=A0ACB9I3K0_9ASTR|nr:hypothetical protein L1987_29751 [Smallanthus sonchifolius]
MAACDLGGVVRESSRRLLPDPPYDRRLPNPKSPPERTSPSTSSATASASSAIDLLSHNHRIFRRRPPPPPPLPPPHLPPSKQGLIEVESQERSNIQKWLR